MDGKSEVESDGPRSTRYGPPVGKEDEDNQSQRFGAWKPRSERSTSFDSHYSQSFEAEDERRRLRAQLNNTNAQTNEENQPIKFVGEWS